MSVSAIQVNPNTFLISHMQKRFTINYLKTFRERTGFLLQDMAKIIGMHSGNLSKIETGQVTPSIDVILAYHLILKIPIERLFKNHIKYSLKGCLLRSEALEQELLDEKASKPIYKRLDLLKIIIDRIKETKELYENR